MKVGALALGSGVPAGTVTVENSPQKNKKPKVLDDAVNRGQVLASGTINELINNQ